MQASRKTEEIWEEQPQPLTEHLSELRKKGVRCLLAFAVCFCFTYQHAGTLVRFLEAPLLAALPKENAQLVFTGIADKFLVYFKVSALAAIFLAFPYLLLQAWAFLSPALKRKERKQALPFIAIGSAAFLCGLAFCYYLILPEGYSYLVNFGEGSGAPTEKAMISLTEYFSLTLQLLLAVGLVFEVPVALVFLGRLGIVTSATLAKLRKQALLASALIAAVVTPSPDAFTMLLVLIPLYLLYELGILGVKMVE